ncbi:MAG: 50S ribosomal protein L21e [Nanopusillaceae archaeon]
MVDRKGKGSRRKSRDKLSKKIREKGKIKIKNILKKFNSGDSVSIVIDPSYHKGMPHPKFHGLSGKVINKRGDCYEVLIEDKGKEKIIIVHPAHLKQIRS